MPKKAAKPTKKAASSKPAPKADKPAKAKAPAKPSKPAAKPVAKAPAKPAPKAPAKPAKPEPKASSKVEVKPKPGAKVEAAAHAKLHAKPHAKPHAPADAKPHAQADAKSAASAKPAPGKGAPAKAPAKPDAKPNPAQPKKPISVAARPPAKRPKGGPVVPVMPAGIGRLMDPSNPTRKPLISSGPKAAHVRPLGAHGLPQEEEVTHKAKSPLSPEQLAEFRVLLVKKRGELVGDINTMEAQALQGGSGSLSNMPSHLAEQGSEAYDQSLSLDLAAADRKMLKEIEDAIKRIDEGTYGVCEKTGKPIKLERLRELPWARYSIEAALELERQSMRS